VTFAAISLCVASQQVAGSGGGGGGGLYKELHTKKPLFSCV